MRRLEEINRTDWIEHPAGHADWPAPFLRREVRFPGKGALIGLLQRAADPRLKDGIAQIRDPKGRLPADFARRAIVEMRMCGVSRDGSRSAFRGNKILTNGVLAIGVAGNPAGTAVGGEVRNGLLAT